MTFVLNVSVLEMWEFESEILFIEASSATSKGVFWANIHIQVGKKVARHTRTL